MLAIEESPTAPQNNSHVHNGRNFGNVAEPACLGGPDVDQMVKGAFLEDPECRVNTLFFGGDYHSLSPRVGRSSFLLLMECLPRFLKQIGARILYETRIGHQGRSGPPCYRTIDSAKIPIQAMTEGLAFIDAPCGRTIISAERDRDQFTATVYMRTGCQAFLDAWEVFCKSENYLRGKAFFADGKLFNESCRYTWDDIALPAQVRQIITTHVIGFLRHRDQLRRFGFKSRRGIILEGPPGTGKTLIGKILAQSLGCSFIWVHPRHIDGAASFAEILRLARFVSPAVIFLEDLDLFGEDRDNSKALALGELMNQLDGASENQDIVTIATTNRLEVIERALQNRPGRFDRIVSVPPPPQHCRKALFARLLRRAEIAEADLAYLVQETDGCTAAQVEEIVNSLFLLALESSCNELESASELSEGVSIRRENMTRVLTEVRKRPKSTIGFHTGE